MLKKAFVSLCLLGVLFAGLIQAAGPLQWCLQVCDEEYIAATSICDGNHDPFCGFQAMQEYQACINYCYEIYGSP